MYGHKPADRTPQITYLSNLHLAETVLSQSYQSCGPQQPKESDFLLETDSSHNNVTMLCSSSSKISVPRPVSPSY